MAPEDVSVATQLGIVHAELRHVTKAIETMGEVIKELPCQLISDNQVKLSADVEIVKHDVAREQVDNAKKFSILFKDVRSVKEEKRSWLKTVLTLLLNGGISAIVAIIVFKLR